MKKEQFYNTILIGAGAGGLFFGAACPLLGEASGNGAWEASGANCNENSRAICGTGGRQSLLILEKTDKIGTKLLMSGAGQCNITHGGSIKDFLSHYGGAGKRLRTLLYKHNNLELMDFMQALGVRCAEREDGKVFPSSLSAAEVRRALLRRCQENGVEIKTCSEVVQVLPLCGAGSGGSFTAGACMPEGLSQAGDPLAACETAGGGRGPVAGFEAVACGARDFGTAGLCGTGDSGVAGGARGFEAGACGTKGLSEARIPLAAGETAGGGADSCGGLQSAACGAAGESGFHGGAGFEARACGACDSRADGLNDAGACGARFRLLTSGGESYTCSNLVVAPGGASYPTTGSDGSLLQVLRRDLPELGVTPLRPALSPVFVENYPFGDLSGISFHNVEIKIFPPKSQKATKLAHPCGDLLLTHKNFSGPVILNNSRQIFTGCGLEINFVFPYTVSDMISQMKRDFPKNHRRISTYIGEKYLLPKKFVAEVLKRAGVEDKPAAGLSGKEITQAAEGFAKARFSVSGTGGFNVAMATSGGVSLDSVSLSDMQSKPYPGLYFLGEVLDIDGDTGGYNLQLAYSTARTAAENIFLAK